MSQRIVPHNGFVQVDKVQRVTLFLERGDMHGSAGYHSVCQAQCAQCFLFKSTPQAPRGRLLSPAPLPHYDA